MPHKYGVMLTTNINTVAQMALVIEDQYFVQHPNLDIHRKHLYRFNMVSNDFVHLSALGYRQWFLNLDEIVGALAPGCTCPTSTSDGCVHSKNLMLRIHWYAIWVHSSVVEYPLVKWEVPGLNPGVPIK